MYEEIYIDVVFAANFFMDYMLLCLVGRIFCLKKRKGRCIAAALLGALFSCLILWIPMNRLLPVRILFHGACAVGMIRIGYGLKKGGLLAKAMIALYLAAFLCGGFWEVLSTGRSMTLKTFVLFAAGTYLSLSALLYLSESFRAHRKNLYPVTLSYQGKIGTGYGFYDTGNLLMDPAGNRPVSILDSGLLEEMMPRELVEQLKYLKEEPGEFQSTELVGLKPHFLPYQTIGQKQGILLAVTLEKLCIHTPKELVHISDPVFALSFEPSALGKEYKVLLNSRLLH